nr:T9SS type A sorting domain-containing protein [uncultured Psychroserpens sp.]
MKHFYLLVCLFCFNAFAQDYQFQIELVDSNVGRNTSNPPISYTNESNDVGLNQIFQNNNVFYYTQVYGFISEELIGKMGVISCSNCDPNILVQQLLAYNTVIKYAINLNGDTSGYFYNSLRLNLLSATNGSYQSIDNGLVVTNNSDLNQIFSNHNVRFYNDIGTATNTYKELICDCNAQLLKQELDNLTAVIDFTENINYVELLSTEDVRFNVTEVYPNPFKNKVTLKTNNELRAIEIYDILGKSILKTESKSVFESRAVSLKTGVYILRLTNVDGKIITKKLIKE